MSRTEANRLVVSVVRKPETGPGLSAEARERLFEPFFTTKSEGTGLGLAIAKRVLEEMGGTIELVLRPDAPGTLARIELPAPPLASAAPAPGKGARP